MPTQVFGLDILSRIRGIWFLCRFWIIRLGCDFCLQVNIGRYKSRLVVDGKKYVGGVDYTKIFAPVISYTTLHYVYFWLLLLYIV